MISNIIDSNGILVFTGNDADSKFATILAKAGHSRVDIPSQFRESKWDGSKWINNEQPPTYADKRKAEYPSIAECVHAILDNELDALQVKRQAVKKKYPKENN